MREATPDPASVTVPSVSVVLVAVTVPVVSVSVAPVGAVLSSTRSRTRDAEVFPATSYAVTATCAVPVVPADQENGFDTYGPPAGVVVRAGECDQPVVEPVSALVAAPAGPEPASVTALVSVVRRQPGSYETYRRRLGRSILLGLEFLVAADIIRTVAVTSSFSSVPRGELLQLHFAEPPRLP